MILYIEPQKHLVAYYFLASTHYENIYIYASITLWHLETCMSIFIVGLALKQIHPHLDGLANDSMPPPPASTSLLLKRLQNLKAGLAPMMLLMFVCKCILLINIVFDLANPTHATGKLLMTIKLASYALDLLYVTLVVEDTAGLFMELAIKLRYIHI